MSDGVDRRPWLILSRTEASVLVAAALAQTEPRALSAPLRRAIRMVDLQLRWIDGAADGLEPTAAAAVGRESACHAAMPRKTR